MITAGQGPPVARVPPSSTSVGCGGWLTSRHLDSDLRQLEHFAESAASPFIHPLTLLHSSGPAISQIAAAAAAGGGSASYRLWQVYVLTLTDNGELLHVFFSEFETGK